MGFLRGIGESMEGKVEQFACTLQGGQDQNKCDSTKSEDGSGCVWCTVSTIGLCVSEDIALQIKSRIPTITCDDDTKNDDDSASADDDKSPPDDDAAPTDDTVPSDYWKCLMDYKTSGECATDGCAWCDTKAGFGICMDEKAAENANQSDWFTCTMSSSLGDAVVAVEENNSDPSDPSCLVATISGDETSCKSTMDVDGNPCEWCSMSTYNFCLNADQAQTVEGYGISCGEDVIDNVVGDEDLSDPSDPSCLVATMSGDESSCTSTMDAAGKSCEWCSFGDYNFCLNDDQAQMAEGYGVSCSEDVVDNVVGDEDLSDPSDPSCLVATMSGDESSCTSTMDAAGKSCEWCSFGDYNFCLNDDQAQMAEGYGVSCGDDGDIENINDSITTSIY